MLAVVAAAGVWLWRDLPRRQVETALERRLGAQVHLGAISILGTRSFILHDLVIRRMVSQPRLARLGIGALHVTGSVGEILDARFETLRAVDLEARLTPAVERVAPPDANAEPIQATVGRLVVEKGRLVLGAVEQERPEDVALDVEAALTGVGGSVSGVVRMESKQIGLEPLLRAIAGPGPGPLPGGAWPEGTVDGFSVEVRISEEGRRFEAAPRAERITLVRRSVTSDAQQKSREDRPGETASPSPGDSHDATLAPPATRSGTGPPSPTQDETLTLPGPEASILVQQDEAGGLLRVEVHPTLPSLFEAASLTASLKAASWELAGLEADVRGLDLGPVLAFLSVVPEGWEVAGRADFEAHGNGDAVEYAARARVPRASARLETGSVQLEVLTITARGSIPLGDGERAARERSGASPGPDQAARAAASPSGGGGAAPGSSGDITLAASLDLTSASGSLGGHPFPPGFFPLRGTFDGHIRRSGGLALAGTSVLTMPSAGRIAMEGTVALDTSALDVRWRWSGLDLDRLVQLAGEAGVQLPQSFDISGSGEGHGTLGGSSADPRIAGELRASSVNLASRPWSVRKGEASLRFDWPTPEGVILLPGIDALGEVTIDPLEAIAVTVSATGRFDPARGELTIETSRVEAPDMLRANARGRARVWSGEAGSSESAPSARGVSPTHSAQSPIPSADERASGTVTIEGADLSRWMNHLRPLIGDPAPGYAVQGNADAELRGDLAWDGTWKGTGRTSIRKSGFSSQDGSQVLQGLETRWDLALSGNQARSHLSVRATADVGGFELLWGSYYVGGSSLTSKLEVALDLERAGAAWSHTSKVAWSFPEGPRAEVSIETAPGRALAYALRFDAPDLAKTVDRYLSGPLGDSIPLMKKVKAEGSVHLDGRGTFSDRARTLAGRLLVADMRLTGTEGLAEMQGLSLDLPVDLRWEHPGSAGAAVSRDPSDGRPRDMAETQSLRITGEPREGRFRFARLTVRGLEVPPLATGLRVRADAVSLDEELSVKLLDGRLALQQMALVDLLQPTRRLEAAVRLDGLSMEAAMRAFGLPPIAGTLEGRFPRVRMTPGTLEVEGGGEVRVFGGVVKVGTISGEDVLSRYPKLTFSAQFEGLDLGQVTRQFDFGEMTGIVRGRVTDCTLFGGVPIAFDALLETEERKGVPRTINVKAIKNLTILGTGTSSNVFDRGIQKFFDKYTYDRIGIQVTMRDDQMTLRGLEKSGERELFVKGRLPFPINVINAQPGSAVSFQDMVERLKGLDLGRATVQR